MQLKRTASETVVSAEPVLRPGDVAARLDRLPLSAVHWHYGLVTQVAWGLIILDDGIVARLYPFVWQSHFSTFVYSILNAIQIGIGILAGEYLVSWFSDRFGRKLAMILSGLISGVFMLFIAFTNSPILLGILLFVQALGMGGILVTNATYLHEIVPPRFRGRLSMGSQSITRPIAFGAIWIFFFWVPGNSPTDYRYAIYVLAAAPTIVLIPFLLTIPESPRWLETKGRMAAASRVLERMEYRASKGGTVDLPPPDYSRHEVIQAQKVPIHEVFRGQYARRTALLLICWILGYGGIVYGFGAFRALQMVAYGFTPHFIFLSLGITALVGGGAAFWINAALNERIERRAMIGISAFVYTVGVVLFYIFSGFIARSPIVMIISFLLTSFGTAIWLFQMYNYTAAAYPTRLRSVGTGWTDGVGHLGALAGTIIIVALYTSTASTGHIGSYLYLIIPGSLIPALLMWRFGIKQKEGILEELSR